MNGAVRRCWDHPGYDSEACPQCAKLAVSERQLRGRQEAHEHCLDRMTAIIIEGRTKRPHLTAHCAAVRTKRSVYQLVVRREVAEQDVRADLASQLAAINAREAPEWVDRPS